MTDSINTIGFIFNKTKTIIKCDKKKKYNKFCCPNNFCVNNLYKVCVFKFEKKNFISSTLNIVTDNQNSWEIFKQNIDTLLNAFFIISVTKSNKLHSFNAKFFKYKMCDCCDAIIAYFIFNIVPFNLNVNTPCYKCIPITSSPPTTSSIIPNYWPTNENDNNKIIYNTMANFAYKNLKSTTYDNVKFFYCDTYSSYLCFTNECVDKC